MMQHIIIIAVAIYFIILGIMHLKHLDQFLKTVDGKIEEERRLGRLKKSRKRAHA